MILAAVEQLAPDASGAFVVEIDDARVGTVFVERNRVCWAAYTGLNRRLRDLLREHLAWALDGDRLAREQAKAEAMRQALEQHTIESLLALPQDQGEEIEFVEHRNQGYRPRFTFSPAELLVAVNRMLYASEAAGTELGLSLVDETARAASFVPADAGGLVAIRMIGPRTSISDLDELGDWAEAAFGVTRGFSREVMKRAIDAATGELCVAWRTSRAHTHAAVLERGETLDRLISQLDVGNLPAIISRRAHRSS
jgi:hypothetical protein